MLYYIRDEKGDSIGLVYNDTKYYYKKNYQGDIVGIYDSNYDLIVNYKYDSWGKLISITDSNNNIITNTSNIGYINPLRYRGYYYSETGLYYLNSRYYNPEWGRFINADVYLTAPYYNIYLYCNNNTINYKDINGNVALAIAIGFGLLTVGVLIYTNNDRLKGKALDEIVQTEYENKNKSLQDVTDKLNNKMKQSALELKQMTKVKGPLGSALIFRDAVTNEGIYDLKLQDEWKGVFK